MGRFTDAWLRRLALALFAVVVAFDLLYVVCMRAVEGNPGLTYPSTRLEVGEVLGVLAAAATGLVVAWMRPRNPIGWLLLATGLSLATCDLGQAYGARALLVEPHLPAGTWALALSAPLWLPALLIPVTSVLVRYPSGRIEGRWPRRFDRLVLLGWPPLYVGYATGRHSVTDMVPDERPPVELPEAVSNGLAMLGGLLVAVGLVCIALDALRRTWRSRGDERTALLLLLGTAVAAVVTAFVGPYEWTLTVAFWSVLAALAVGVLRYGALGIEVTVLHGDRNDPFTALNRLGAPLGQAVDERSLPHVLASLVDALGVSGVAVQGPVEASAGELPPEPLRVPLSFGGADLGHLLVGSRPGQARPDSTDRRMAEAVAPLIAAMLHAVRVAEELRVGQARVVEATQAERGRLRQELHDGLGPALTGIGLGLEALAPRVPEQGEEMVARLRAEVAASLEETRRIIDDLRPAALDGTDLATALGRRAAQVTAAGALRVDFRAPDALPVLPPPVAAAAFRVAEEALTNAVRHAHAAHCAVELTVVDHELHVSVTDDGVGFAGPRPDGVGLTSMLDRAERLGGRLTIASADPGTRVEAVIPIGGVV